MVTTETLKRLPIQQIHQTLVAQEAEIQKHQRIAKILSTFGKMMMKADRTAGSQCQLEPGRFVKIAQANSEKGARWHVYIYAKHGKLANPNGNPLSEVYLTMKAMEMLALEIDKDLANGCPTQGETKHENLWEAFFMVREGR